MSGRKAAGRPNLVIICAECRHTLNYCRCEITRPRLDVTKLSSSMAARPGLNGPDARTRADMRRACQERAS